jgi:hypothetical protein
LTGFVALAILFGIATGISEDFLSRGGGVGLLNWRFWSQALVVVGLIVMAIGMLFVLAVTSISPKSANRAILGRSYLLGIWLLTGAISIIWFLTGRGRDAGELWTMGMTSAFSTTLFIAICERDDPGPRVRRAIPRSRLLRIPAFLLYSQSAGGIAYSVLMLALTLLVGIWFWSGPRWTSYYGSVDLMQAVTCISVYSLCYALTAHAIRRAFFSRIGRPDIATAVVALSLLIGGTVIPMVIGFILRPNPWVQLNPRWYIGNPFSVLWYKNMWDEALTFSSLWAMGAVSLALPWFVRKARAFKPLNESAGLPLGDAETANE